MKNILFYGDYDCTTGFGNVSKELVNEFSKEKVISQNGGRTTFFYNCVCNK